MVAMVQLLVMAQLVAHQVAVLERLDGLDGACVGGVARAARNAMASLRVAGGAAVATSAARRLDRLAVVLALALALVAVVLKPDLDLLVG